MATNYEKSKSKKLHDFFAEVFGTTEDTTEIERIAMAQMEMNLDVTLAMATGNISSWVQLAMAYDDDRSLIDQDAEFQRQLAITISSGIGVSLVAHSAGMTGLEFAVGRSVALSPITRVLYSPLIVAPAGMIYLSHAYPEIAGPQYQSSITGQPNIGGSALNKKPAKTWSEFFSPSYWGLSRRG